MKKNYLNQKKAYVFRNWSRNKKAVLFSLGSSIKIAVLSFSYCLLFKGLPTYGQTDTINFNQNIDIEEVAVIGKKMPDLYASGGRSIEVLTRKEIDKLNVSGLDELLKGNSLIDIRQRGPLGIQSDISIRGGSFDQTLILLNGVSITDPQTGHHSLNIPVNFETIERVEILYGSAARAHGANAFAGVLNIVTRPDSTDYLSISSDFGSYGFNSTTVQFNQSLKNFSHSLSYQNGRSEGYIKNTDFTTQNLYYQSSLDLKYLDVNLNGGFTDKNFGAYNYYHPKSEAQYEEIKTWFGNIRANYGNRVKHNTSASIRKHFDTYQFLRIGDGYYVKTDSSWIYPDAVYSDYKNITLNAFNSWFSPNYHETKSMNFEHSSLFSYGNFSTTLGITLQTDHIKSNKLGTPTSNRTEVFDNDSVFYTNDYNRHSINYFIEQNYSYQDILITAGILLYQNSDLEQLQYFPGAEIAWYVNEYLKLRGSYNYTLRLPTFTDLFLVSGSNLGNPELKPENAHSYDAGFKLKSRTFSFDQSFFYRNGENIIDWVYDSTTSKYVATNIPYLNTFGSESNFYFHPDNLPFNIMLKYAYMQSNRPIEINSKYALDHLKHKFSGILEINPFRNFYTVVNFQLMDRAGNYEYLTDDDQILNRGYKPQNCTDIVISYKKNDLETYLRVDNLFDQNLRGIGGIPMPGRWIILGFKAKINL